MKTKSFITLLFLSLLTFWSCGSGQDDFDTPVIFTIKVEYIGGGIDTITTAPVKNAPYISSSSNHLYVDGSIYCSGVKSFSIIEKN